MVSGNCLLASLPSNLHFVQVMHSLYYGGTLTFKAIAINNWCSVDVTARLAHKLMKNNLMYLKERPQKKFMTQVVSVGYGE